jgi:diacylglycerol O-acyltransferase
MKASCPLSTCDRSCAWACGTGRREEFELDYHLRHLALPQPGRIRELLAMVSRLHGNLLDRNRPLWEIYVIEGLPGGRFAVYSKIHHALVDGVSGARMMANA